MLETSIESGPRRNVVENYGYRAFYRQNVGQRVAPPSFLRHSRRLFSKTVVKCICALYRDADERRFGTSPDPRVSAGKKKLIVRCSGSTNSDRKSKSDRLATSPFAVSE